MLDIPDIKNGLDAYIKAKKLKKTSLSYSQMSNYWECPFRWQLATINKIRTYKPSIHTLFGSAMHETIQVWLKTRFDISIEDSNLMDLPQILFDNMVKEYQNDIPKHGKYVSSKELSDIYESGVQILKFLKENVDDYFPTKNHKFIGYEVPIFVSSDTNSNVIISGFIDLVIYNEKEDYYILDDLKTSKSSWDDFKKKNFNTIGQLLTYKYYFSKQYDIPIEKIKTRFVILKKQLNEHSRWQEKRIQLFEPSTGKIKLKEFKVQHERMIQEAFSSKGTHIQKKYPKTNNKNNCIWCDYKGTKYCNGFK